MIESAVEAPPVGAYLIARAKQTIRAEGIVGLVEQMLNLRTAPNTGGGPAHKNDLEEETWAKEAGAPSTVPTQILVAHREQFAIDALAQELAAQATAVLGVTNPADLQTCLARGPQISAAIVDFRLFSASGLDQLRKLLARLGDVPVILFASGLEARVIALALQAGVRGIIPATMPLKAISSVLYLVQLGQVFTGGPPLKNAPGDGQSSRSLTDEEYGVLRRVALGDTNKQIAGEFGVTEVRVKMLMRAICRKIEARNRAHACVIAREQGLL